MNSYCRDFTKICRVCMSDGSRDIFHKTAPSPIPSPSSGGANTSPLDRLVEKLRYVTMMKIEENDDLPRLLCDLCIVQLNVAYNFKRQAVENDTKLRQYFIENGISSNNTNTNMNNNTNSNATFNENQNTRNNLTHSVPVNNSVPIVPFIIKTEPSDNDTLSDITTETNLDGNRMGSFTPLIQTNTLGRETIGGNNDSGIEIFNKEKHNSSVVYINGYGCKNSTSLNDIEYINNYVNSSSSSSAFNNLRQQQQQQHQQQQHPGANNKNRNSMTQNIDTSPSTSKATPSTSNNNTTSKKQLQGRLGKFELKKLSIDMNLPLPAGKRRKTRQNEENQLTKQNTPLNNKNNNSKNGGITKLNQNNNKSRKSKLNKEQKNSLLTNNVNKISKTHQNILNNNDNNQHTLLINPYCSIENEPKAKKKRLYNEGRIKEKTVRKFIEPKLEPTDK